MLGDCGEVVRLVVSVATVHCFLKAFVFKPLAESIIRGPEDKEVEEKRAKFLVSAWKFTAYVALLVWAYFAVRHEQDWFWDLTKYHEPYRTLDGSIPPLIRQLYLGEIAFYLYSSIGALWEHEMSDFGVMMMHHLFTLTLLISSHYFEISKYGVAIMILHDLADPFMELAKILLYAGYKGASNFFLGCFAVLFIGLRDYAFPRYIIWPTWRNLVRHQYGFRGPTIACLVALWLLHLFWTVLIFKVLLRTLCGQHGDVREKEH